MWLRHCEPMPRPRNTKCLRQMSETSAAATTLVIFDEYDARRVISHGSRSSFYLGVSAHLGPYRVCARCPTNPPVRSPHPGASPRWGSPRVGRVCIGHFGKPLHQAYFRLTYGLDRITMLVIVLNRRQTFQGAWSAGAVGFRPCDVRRCPGGNARPSPGMMAICMPGRLSRPPTRGPGVEDGGAL
jgi:hypothetical protein